MKLLRKFLTEVYEYTPEECAKISKCQNCGGKIKADVSNAGDLRMIKSNKLVPVYCDKCKQGYYAEMIVNKITEII